MEILLVLAVLVVGGGVWFITRRKRGQDKLPKNLSMKQTRPRAAAPQAAAEVSSVREEVSLQPVEAQVAAAVEPKDAVKPSAQSEIVPSTVICPSHPAGKAETLPEDSMLRRHYLSTRQAEKLAITNPYPQDATLRRHYDSMSAIKSDKLVVAAKIENTGPAVIKPRIPEDSTLRRHFLAQLQAEIESHLPERPTDSALRRHFDAQVKAKMDEYLLEMAA